jgi:predicted regulator of Ras-like GTPase activity (Roadblock/LC7/MglB family)
MADINETIQDLLSVEGAKAAAVVDSASGMVLGKEGSGVDLDAAGAGNTEVVRAKLKTMKSLGLKDSIDDILITLTSQYHIIRPLASKPAVFLYLVLDKSKSNLALARIKVADCDANLSL